MVTIGYPPDQIGGTEIYVQGLVEALGRRGYQCDIAYVAPFDGPGSDVEVRTRSFEGSPVHVVAVNRRHHKLEFIPFDAALRQRMLEAFDRIVDAVAPDIVHVHPLVLSFESYLIERLRGRGQRIVLTYHSSTTGCARGDLVYFGKTVCDGRIRQQQCTACLYHQRGVPLPAAVALSWLPRWLARSGYQLANLASATRRLRSFFSIPLMIEAGAHAWSRAMRNADAVVAVCQWVREVMLGNAVPAEKITLARHGLRIDGSRCCGPAPSGPACFGYLGRIGPEKGIGVLVETLEGLPKDVVCRFEFCSATFRRADLRADERKLVDRIRRLAETDPRVVILGHVPDKELAAALARWDALVAPSLWLESGPQVVYEAFSVRTPVIGSDLGGIKELVAHGRTGLLVPANDAAALRGVLMDCAANPGRLRCLRENIPEVRTTADVAADMCKVYERVLEPAACNK
jgi:glycosyltransferase involved in cell wall biosynthesis